MPKRSDTSSQHSLACLRSLIANTLDNSNVTAYNILHENRHEGEKIPEEERKKAIQAVSLALIEAGLFIRHQYAENKDTPEVFLPEEAKELCERAYYNAWRGSQVQNNMTAQDISEPVSFPSALN